MKIILYPENLTNNNLESMFYFELNKFYNKKAAMFGLDARVALAIFGALSIITGAALFSALEKIKTVKYHNFFNEVVKASEAYYLDNGKPIPLNGAIGPDGYTADLVTNREGLSTWKGPYANFIEPTGDDLYITPFKGIFGINFYMKLRLRSVSEWPSNSTKKCFLNNLDCAEYFYIHAHSGQTNGLETLSDIFLKLDKYIDNSDGMTKGKIRKFEEDATSHYLYYQGPFRVIKS